MFRSTRRGILIPQAEHARLSGALARIWGNSEFALPSLPFTSFLTGVMFHDRGYPDYDEDEIGNVDEFRWLALQKAGAEKTSQDSIADLVVKFHVKRLLGYRPTPERQSYLESLEELISEKLASCDVPRKSFELADEITHLCDNISFDFCHEEERSGTLIISADQMGGQLSEMQYRCDGLGGIYLTPWPFAVSELAGTIIGFREQGYPNQLEPCCIPYSVKPMSQRNEAGVFLE